MQWRRINMFTCNMIRTDVGLFLKGLKGNVAASCLVVTLCLVDRKLAIHEERGSHISLNQLLSNEMLEACSKFTLLIQIR